MILFHLENRLCMNKFLIKAMIPLDCENLSFGTSSSNMATGCLRELFQKKNSQTECLTKYLNGTICPDTPTAYLRN